MLVYDKKRAEREEYPWVCPVVAANEYMEELGGRWTEATIPVQGEMHRAERDKEALALHIKRGKERYAEMEERLLNNNFSPNSLGEDQGRGAEMDRLCGLFHRSAEDLSKWLEKNFPDRYGQPKEEPQPVPLRRYGSRSRRGRK